MGDSHKKELEDAKRPEKKRKIVENEDVTHNKGMSTLKKDRNGSRDDSNRSGKGKTTPTPIGPVTDTEKEMNMSTKNKKPTPIGPVTDTGIEQSDNDIEMTGVESSDVEMKEVKDKREPRRRDRKPKSSKDDQISDSSMLS